MNKKIIKQIAKTMNPKACPKCGSTNCRNFNRTNWPYGKKSKSIKSSGRQCLDCNYIKYK